MLTPRFKRTVTALAVTLALTTPLAAQQTDLDGLFQELIEADETTHERVADRIRARFEKSGSASMDLLFRRGAEAVEEGDLEIAIEHFSALIDHAPDFAEGYHSRASAFFSAGMVGLAIDDLRQTLVLNPRHFEAMFGVGIILEELGRDDDAIAAYQAIQEIYPLDRPQAAAALERLELKASGQSI
ncbi:MAG: tetratricopeptide repeat protein [Pseudomonadota bacterium]